MLLQYKSLDMKNREEKNLPDYITLLRLDQAPCQCQ